MLSGPVLATAMSAAVGVIVTDEWLLVVLGSGVADVTAEEFVNAPGVLGAVTTSVKVCCAPFASDATNGHVTTRPATVGVGVPLTKVAPTGSVSVTTTFVAVEGPLFLTVSV